jgi:photosystem II stability/assembly factor-like uncharacterized protein
MGAAAVAVALAAAAALGDDGAAPAVAAAPPGPGPALTVEHAETGLLLGIADTGERLVAVGGNGDIVVSDDGQRWAQVPSPVDVTLTAVAFADSRNGWAVGHDAVILHTADGGHSWTLQNFQPDLNAPLFSILALDAQRAFAAGAFGTLKATVDGGASWTDVNAEAISADKLHLNAITRLANGDLFVAGEHGLAALSSDGRNWRRLESPYEGSFFGVQPWGSQGVLAFGLRGNIYAMADARLGRWQKIEAQTTSSLFGGLAIPDGKAVLVGGDGELVAVDGSGNARRLGIGAGGKGQAKAYAALVGYRNGLVLAGEAGITRIVP